MSTAEVNFGYADYAPNPVIYEAEAVNSDGTLRIVFPQGQLSVESSILAEDFMDVRHDFVQRQGWCPGAVDDVDSYDFLDTTSYVIKSEGENPGRVLGGLRLTHVRDIDSSLTWHMMDKNPAMQAAASTDQVAALRLKEVADQGGLYDLTRLVLALDGRLQNKDVKETLLDLIGGGVAATESGYAKTAWIYLATESMKKFLDRHGIVSDMLVADKVTPTDEKDSYLCVVYPQDAMEGLRTSASISDRETHDRIDYAAKSF